MKRKIDTILEKIWKLPEEELEEIRITLKQIKGMENALIRQRITHI